jgi:hypothetical protein
MLPWTVLAESADHYNGIAHIAPWGKWHRWVRRTTGLPAGSVVRRDRLGGLIHEYAQAA